MQVANSQFNLDGIGNEEIRQDSKTGSGNDIQYISIQRSQGLLER